MSELKILDVSPFVEDVSDEPELTAVETSNELVKIYKTLPELLLNLIKKYKFLSTLPKKMIWEATAEDITDDVVSAKFDLNLDKAVKSQYASLLNIQKINSKFCEQLDMIGGFVEWCYIYYIHTIDKYTPFYKLPVSTLKFNLVVSALKSNTNSRDKAVNEAFLDILNNSIMARLRNKPPIYLTGEYDLPTLKDTYTKKLIPLCKKLIESLLMLPASRKTTTKVENDTVTYTLPIAPEIMARENNLDLD